MYSNVDDLRFGATPGGSGHPQPGYAAGRPHPTVPAPRSAQTTDWPPHWTSGTAAGLAHDTAEQALGHPSDTWQQAQATGQWDVSGGWRGTAVAAEETGEWRFAQAMGPQQAVPGTGPGRAADAPADDWRARPDTRTDQWDTGHWDTAHFAHTAHTAHSGRAARTAHSDQDTGQWDTGQWDTGQWEHGRAADHGTGATGEWRTGGFAAVGADTHGHAAADPGPGTAATDTAMTDTAATDTTLWDMAVVDAGPSGADEEWGQATDDGAEGEWNPTADSIRPVRGRHRVMKQRGGLARSSTVLGVGVIAAVGAGGIASAQGGKPPVHISVPDLSSVQDKLPEAASSIPVVGHLLAGDSAHSDTAAAPLTSAGVTADDVKHGTTDPGEALRDRILQQAEQQQEQAAQAVAQSAEDAAVKKAADEAGKQKEEAEKKAAAEKKRAEEAAKRKAEAERLAKLAKSFTLPVSSYTLTSHFGDPGAMWSSGYHTGLDFAAPTGTPLKAIHGGTVKEAGWSGSYGYRTVIELSDGTELWYCHQSSISVSVGQQVSTGQVIGRVGATGNVTGPHLHLEVHPGGGSAIDPLAWLQGKGIQP